MWKFISILLASGYSNLLIFLIVLTACFMIRFDSAFKLFLSCLSLRVIDCSEQLVVMHSYSFSSHFHLLSWKGGHSQNNTMPQCPSTISDQFFVLGMGSLFKLVWGHGM